MAKIERKKVTEGKFIMVEAISLSPHYITATALATKPCTPSSRWLRKRKRGFLATHDTPHTSCLLQYSTKLSQSKKEALKIANRTRLTNTASCCMDAAGRLASFLLYYFLFLIIALLISLEALLAVYYCGRLL